MAFGRKARRIRQLETEVIDLRDNLAVAVVKMGESITARIEVRKGVWYHVGYEFMHNGTDTLDTRSLFVGEHDSIGPYFDGEQT